MGCLTMTPAQQGVGVDTCFLCVGVFLDAFLASALANNCT